MHKPITTIAQLNQQNREFWKRQNRLTNTRLARPYVLGPAVRRENEKADYLGSAIDQAERIRRLREQKPFESELEAIDQELAPRRFFLAQQVRAQKPRGKVTKDGKTLGQVIRRVVLLNPKLRTKQLWPIFTRELLILGLGPTVDASSLPCRESCEYSFKAGRKRITERQFANVVSKVRSAERRKQKISR